MVGYPIGGDTISVTSGVVSRIEVTSYVHGSTELLGVQIDAAINSGNSGERVSSPNTLAFPCFSDSQSLFCTLYARLAPVSGVMMIQAHTPVHSVLFYWKGLVYTAALLLAVNSIKHSIVLCNAKKGGSAVDVRSS